MNEYGKFSEEKWDEILKKKGKLPIRLTQAEYEEVVAATLDENGIPVNPTTAKLLLEKGIIVDSGDIKLSVEGKLKKMDTSKNDFGTVAE